MDCFATKECGGHESLRDRIWPDFSTLGAGVNVYAMQLHLQQKRPNLKLLS